MVVETVLPGRVLNDPETVKVVVIEAVDIVPGVIVAGGAVTVVPD